VDDFQNPRKSKKEASWDQCRREEGGDAINNLVSRLRICMQFGLKIVEVFLLSL